MDRSTAKDEEAMIREVTQDYYGKEIVTLIPETDEDLAELRRMAAEGELDWKASAADYLAEVERDG